MASKRRQAELDDWLARGGTFASGGIPELNYLGEQFTLWFAGYSINERITRLLMRDPPVLHEGEQLRYIRDRMESGAVYVDAGANIGIYSVYFAVICGAEQVHAIEPIPPSVRRLELSIEMNTVGATVTVYPVGLSDLPGLANYQRRPSNYSRAKLFEHPFGEIPVTTIDGLDLPRFDFLKIDCELHSFRALKGAIFSIIKYMPRFVLVELEGKAERATADQFMQQIGYRIDRHFGKAKEMTLYGRQEEKTKAKAVPQPDGG